MVRVKAYFSGMVQGVGFRYTTARLARDYPSVAGFVRNLPDSRVELLAEGEPIDVKAFLQAIQARMAPYIRSIRQCKSLPTGEFNDFRITH
jgi:acylphosphatase